MENTSRRPGEERFTREEIERIWARVMPGSDPGEVIDLLLADRSSGRTPDPLLSRESGESERDPDILIRRETRVRGAIVEAERSCPDAPESEETPEAGAESAEIRALIEEELERSLYYCLLRNLTRNRQARCALDALSNGCYRNAKTLSTAHYLATGEMWFPVDTQPYRPESGFLDSLRESYRAEHYLAERYEALAEDSGDEGIRETAAELAAAHTANALTIRGLIENCVR